MTADKLRTSCSSRRRKPIVELSKSSQLVFACNAGSTRIRLISRAFLICKIFVLAGCAVKTEPPRRPATHFLVIGGGYSPDSNAIAIERNVIEFDRWLDERNVPQDRRAILFADGDDPGRDVQYDDPDAAIPEVNQVLAAVFAEEDGISDRYRTNDIKNVTGPATPERIADWFDKAAGRLRKGDRLFIFVTAHGDPAVDDISQNTSLLLWDDRKLSVEEFTAELDKLDPQIEVVTVMVQCYSGGFANIIYRGGDPSAGLSPARRCGFYSTTFDRVAAGCSPALQDDKYDEYSEPFVAAISGVEPRANVDADHDGAVSWEEAHCFALARLNTIDIPLRTSDQFLLQMTPPENTFDIKQDASPAEQDAIKKLAAALEINDPFSKDALESLEAEWTETYELLDAELVALEDKAEDARAMLERVVIQKWPELAGIWNPRAHAIVREQGDAIVSTVTNHELWEKFLKHREEVAAADERLLATERQLAKVTRLRLLLATVANRASLYRSADQAKIDQYRQLLDLERGVFAE
ncbi:hypothetical protein [Stratiformator vulcanicus]|nr:hypothetical protein [Stratiformator vulcanicus]